MSLASFGSWLPDARHITLYYFTWEGSAKFSGKVKGISLCSSWIHSCIICLSTTLLPDIMMITKVDYVLHNAHISTIDHAVLYDILKCHLLHMSPTSLLHI